MSELARSGGLDSGLTGLRATALSLPLIGDLSSWSSRISGGEDSESFFWRQGEECVVGLGVARAISTTGAERFVDLRARAEQLFAGIDFVEPAALISRDLLARFGYAIPWAIRFCGGQSLHSWVQVDPSYAQVSLSCTPPTRPPKSTTPLAGWYAIACECLAGGEAGRSLRSVQVSLSQRHSHVWL